MPNLKFRPTHVHVLSDLCSRANPVFHFFYGYRRLEKTPGSAQILAQYFGDGPIQSYKLPKIFTDYPLPRTTFGNFKGVIEYEYSPENLLYTSCYYAPKGALGHYRGLGLGYYIETIAVQLLLEQHPEPDRLRFKSSDSNPALWHEAPPSARRIGQLLKIGLKPGTPYPAKDWLNALAIGIEARVQAHARESRLLRLWRRFVHPKLDLSVEFD